MAKMEKNKLMPGAFSARHSYLLSGLVRCGEGGKAMIGETRKGGKSGNETVSYRCNHNHSQCNRTRMSVGSSPTAVEWEFLSENPCERAKPPRIIYKESRYLDEDGAAAVMDALGQEPYRYAIAIYIMLYTGLRRGEVCGLEWSDIDFDKRIMSINRNSLYIPEKGTFTDSLKTYSSSRVINLSDDLIDILHDYRTWHEEQAEMFGDKWKGSERIVTRLDGSPICPDTLSGWFYKFIRKNHLPQISLHSLRHTHATLLIACGIPLKTVSARLGHASPTTTSNIYLHAIQSLNAAAAEAINDILSPGKALKNRKVG